MCVFLYKKSAGFLKTKHVMDEKPKTRNRLGFTVKIGGIKKHQKSSAEQKDRLLTEEKSEKTEQKTEDKAKREVRDGDIGDSWPDMFLNLDAMMHERFFPLETDGRSNDSCE